jgi:hypothetical protein
MKFEAILAMDMDEIKYPREYIDYQTRNPKTKKLGKKRMERTDYSFSYDSPEEEMWPSIDVTLTTTNEELIKKWYENRLGLKGYRWKLTLEEVT